jgi:hypothetical protein
MNISRQKQRKIRGRSSESNGMDAEDVWRFVRCHVLLAGELGQNDR